MFKSCKIYKYFTHLDLFTVSYFKVYKVSSLKLTTKEKFKISFSRTEQNVCLPRKAHRRGFGGRSPSHKFLYLQTAKGWADKAIGQPQTHITPSQQEGNIYNHIHPILTIYKQEIHTVPKMFLGEKLGDSYFQ